MGRADIIAGSILLGISAYIIYAADLLPEKITGAGLGPGVVPMYQAGTLGILAIILLVRNLLNKNNDISQEMEVSRPELTGLVVVFLTQAFYIASIKYLGFGTATLLFVAFLSNTLGKYAWWKCCLYGLSVALITVQVFRNMLGLPLLPGFTGF